MDSDDFAAAFAELKRRVQPDVEPVLTYGEGEEPEEGMDLDDILVAARAASTWEASTAYELGDVVMPSPRDGRRYKVVQRGTSGGSQPSFNTAEFSQTSDGTVIWEEAGPQVANVYDMGRAEHEVWKLRRVKASEYHGQDEQHIYRHCAEMERRTAPVGFA